jgi:superfamily II RNA helicase
MLKRLNPSFMNKKTVSIFSENRLDQEVELYKFSEKIRLQTEKLHDASTILMQEQAELKRLISEYHKKRADMKTAEQAEAAFAAEVKATVQRFVSSIAHEWTHLYLTTIKEELKKQLGYVATSQEIRKICEGLGYYISVAGNKRKNAVIF